MGDGGVREVVVGVERGVRMGVGGRRVARGSEWGS